MTTAQLNVAVVTDCGSTTTKAILIERTADGFRQTFRGEAPTTVEAPYEDVTRGVLNALAELEELSGRRLLDGERIVTPARGREGTDIYLSTSSAGGGLQMTVAGVVANMTAESAQRAALGAGAIVLDVVVGSDGLPAHEKIERLRTLRPDMVLLAGGTDGGTLQHVVALAELVAAACPRARLGAGYRLPVVYAGNREAREAVRQALGEGFELRVTDNLRPVLDAENLGPARDEIHELFLKHVMMQAPGYRKLMSWVGAPIMPTPAAMGNMIRTAAARRRQNIVGVDIGGATTDVFSDFAPPPDRNEEAPQERAFNRSVSANYGMSYSVSNVLADAGVASVMRWLPFDIPESDLRNRVKNKMIRPTTVPQQLDDLIIEQAIAREALRLSFVQHKALATPLKGIRRQRTLGESLARSGPGPAVIEMARLDLLIGSGGVLSHAPRRAQAMQMLIDSFEPEGITQLGVDSIFMMPHLGVLAQVNEAAATEVFERDCMVELGTCVAPLSGSRAAGACFEYVLRAAGETRRGTVRAGELKLEPLARGQSATVELKPSRRVNLGAGFGKTLQATVQGGVVGLVFDGRIRPIVVPAKNRRETLMTWNAAMGLYPDAGKTGAA